jgi:hypothetical protein
MFFLVFYFNCVILLFYDFHPTAKTIARILREDQLKGYLRMSLKIISLDSEDKEKPEMQLGY